MVLYFAPPLLLAKMVTAKMVRANTWRYLSPPIVFLASIGVAFVSIPAAELLWPLAFFIPVAVTLRKDVAQKSAIE